MRSHHRQQPGKRQKQAAHEKPVSEQQQQQPQPRQRQKSAASAIEDVIMGASARRNSKEICESVDALRAVEKELDVVCRDYSQQLNDTQLSFVADKDGNLRLAYNRCNAVFHAYQDILQQLLLRLDSIPSYGDVAVRAKCKSIVKKIQTILDSLDQFAVDQESEFSESSSA
ncbi:hypothetical protein IWW50_002624 [Coemansia erecta]|nr:hypothetical protein IWW50_002624 [Coemansia erecta]